MEIKIYDKNHVYIDTLTDFDNPVTIDTLNGVNKFTFEVPINASKTNELTINLGNHVEFYVNDELRWWGFIISRTFNSPDITVGCYGYAHLLQVRRLRAKEYPEKTYGDLIELMLNDINAVQATGIAMGVKDTSSKTQRTVQNNDFAYEKMIEYVNSMNYYIDVDDKFKLNFRNEITQERDYYAKWGNDEFNNLIKVPTLEQSMLEMANSVYGEVKVVDDNGDDNTLSYSTKNQTSINMYGLFEGVTSFNDGVVLQDTVTNSVIEDLNRRSYPLSNMDIQITDTIYAPLNDIKVGHKITIVIEPYFNFLEETRILEIERNYKQNVARLTVGQTLYRQQPPKAIIYK